MVSLSTPSFPSSLDNPALFLGVSGIGCSVEPSLTHLTVTLSLSDEDFGKMVAGKTQAQRLFMSGKLKIKGDIMKATKMEPVLKKAQTKAKL